MSRYSLSQSAAHDLTEIYAYSYRTFGMLKADAYLLAMEECFQQLAHTPNKGRTIDPVRTGYWRYEHLNHSVFYVAIEEGVKIMRVLHNRMDIAKHL